MWRCPRFLEHCVRSAQQSRTCYVLGVHSAIPIGQLGTWQLLYCGLRGVDCMAECWAMLHSTIFFCGISSVTSSKAENESMSAFFWGSPIFLDVTGLKCLCLLWVWASTVLWYIFMRNYLYAQSGLYLRKNATAAICICCYFCSVLLSAFKYRVAVCAETNSPFCLLSGCHVYQPWGRARDACGQPVPVLSTEGCGWWDHQLESSANVPCECLIARSWHPEIASV